MGVVQICFSDLFSKINNFVLNINCEIDEVVIPGYVKKNVIQAILIAWCVAFLVIQSSN